MRGTEQQGAAGGRRTIAGSIVRIVGGLAIVAVLAVCALIGLGVFAVREGLSTVSKGVEIAERLNAMSQAAAAPATEVAMRNQAERINTALVALSVPDDRAAACVDQISYRDGEVEVSLSLTAEFQGKAPRFEIKSPETTVLPFDATTEGTNQHCLRLGEPGPLTLAIKVWIGDAYAGRFVALKGRDMDFKARRAK